MSTKKTDSRKSLGGNTDSEKLDRIVAEARKAQEEREKGYRERSLKLHPWICARCGREFTRENLHMLTVHHKDHNHDNNPPDGSNWENLCLYCHDNEHSRLVDHEAGGGAVVGDEREESATYKPFAALKDLLNAKKS